MKTELAHVIYKLRNDPKYHRDKYRSEVRLWTDGCCSIHWSKNIYLPDLNWNELKVGVADIPNGKIINDNGYSYTSSYIADTPHNEYDITLSANKFIICSADGTKDLSIDITEVAPVGENGLKKVVTFAMHYEDYSKISDLGLVPKFSIIIAHHRNIVISDEEYEEANKEAIENEISHMMIAISKKDWQKSKETNIRSGKTEVVYNYTHKFISDTPINIISAEFGSCTNPVCIITNQEDCSITLSSRERMKGMLTVYMKKKEEE